MTRRLVFVALLLSLVGGLVSRVDGWQTSRLRLMRTLPPPGPPQLPGPPPPPSTDLGGYRAQIPASHGGNSTGGCRVTPDGVPRIVRINSLADTNTLSGILSGAGTATDPYIHTATFRGAWQATFPRCVVFEVSGYITINGNMTATNPYMTIAGQTSPSPGVTIRASATALPNTTTSRILFIATHDTVLQHIRIRPGSDSCNSGIQYYNFENGALQINNNLLDHVTIGWAQDDGIVYNYNAGSSMLWRSIVHEVLAGTPNTQNCTGGGSSLGDGIGVGWGDGIAMLQNLLAHNRERNPQSDGGASGAHQNNLLYAPRLGTWFNSFRAETIAWRWDGNYIKRDSTSQTSLFGILLDNTVTGSQVYYTDNIFDNGTVAPAYTEIFVRSGINPFTGVTSPPGGTTVTNYTSMSASEVHDWVLDRAGARPLDRDSVDQRVVNDVRNRTGSYIATIGQVGGHPTLAQNTRTYVVPANPFSVAAGQTFRTNMEMDLEAFAVGGVTATGTMPAIER